MPDRKEKPLLYQEIKLFTQNIPPYANIKADIKTTGAPIKNRIPISTRNPAAIWAYPQK
jgi:hypothetical protein